ncbi:sensor histidine kinase [Urechidicola croceus]|uniref:histidine kinase n=1 Tax=Urechidicola croceus TaxID=1850246 RepID=A0A1D8PAG1_9FLAO|nr:HAMP domain-containing sensor histidine kinase [Urechidicola croceus]AOW21578.1 two-component sensor histidine kinase [Urechidicola croceus]
MSLFKNTQVSRWIAITASFIIVSLILWNTYSFFQKFKEEERMKMEILGKAYERFGEADLNANIDLENFIIESNNTIPMIITNEEGEISNWSKLNVSDNKTYNSLSTQERMFLNKQLQIMKNQNSPIDVSYNVDDTNVQQFIYYKNSDLLDKLKYYPLALILILLLFSSVIYLFFKSSKVAEQNRLWTGMAKETAHQIGTPLSSLLGWIELLRMENIDENIVPEIEKDVHRLNVIADRFSKIGSIPVLNKHDVVKETQEAFKYLKSRSSKQIEFSFESSQKSLITEINLQLYGWVIENLVKNAIDSMQGKGKLNVSIDESQKNINILISDTGKGIPKALRQKIFTPGYTTKKRGWGLGLSLSKRIVEEYHKGKIFVQKSEIGKGTTFCVSLKKLS